MDHPGGAGGDSHWEEHQAYYDPTPQETNQEPSWTHIEPSQQQQNWTHTDPSQQQQQWLDPAHQEPNQEQNWTDIDPSQQQQQWLDPAHQDQHQQHWGQQQQPEAYRGEQLDGQQDQQQPPEWQHQDHGDPAQQHYMDDEQTMAVAGAEAEMPLDYGDKLKAEEEEQSFKSPAKARGYMSPYLDRARGYMADRARGYMSPYLGQARVAVAAARGYVSPYMVAARGYLSPYVGAAGAYMAPYMDTVARYMNAAVARVKARIPPTVYSFFSKFQCNRNSLVFGVLSLFVVLLILSVVFLAMRKTKKGVAKVQTEAEVFNPDNLIGSFTVAPPLYDYSDDSKGPLNWGELNKDWFACTNGDKQSPVAIISAETSLDSTLPFAPVLGFPGGKLTAGRYRYELDFLVPGGVIPLNGAPHWFNGMQFHIPSEHTVDNVRYRAIASASCQKMIFETADGLSRTVVAVFFETGPNSHPFISEVINWKPATQLNTGLLSLGTKFYRYWGSMTVPPCTQNVIWTVMHQVNELSSDQLSKIKTAMQAFNARPLQALGSRKITRNF